MLSSVFYHTKCQNSANFFDFLIFYKKKLSFLIKKNYIENLVDQNVLNFANFSKKIQKICIEKIKL